MFFKYIISHVKLIIFNICFIGTLLTVFILYRLPVTSIGYSALLCSFIAIIFITADFISFMKKHRQLEILKDNISVSNEHMPQPSNVIEKDYQELIIALTEDNKKIINEVNSKYADMTDYYTLWVHQIKTPISAMRLILQSSNITDGCELTAELQKIEGYAQMVLSYLRLKSDSTDYIIRKYKLDSIIKQALRKYSSQFIRKKIRLNYESINVKILTDEKWLLFVIEQILSNALKYTNTGGEISIFLKPGQILCIKDNGIGISPEDLPRIFEKGFTGYNGRTDKKASGIGLYLCRRICTKLGHQITASSESGIGTEITLDLSSNDMLTE